MKIFTDTRVTSTRENLFEVGTYRGAVFGNAIPLTLGKTTAVVINTDKQVCVSDHNMVTIDNVKFALECEYTELGVYIIDTYLLQKETYKADARGRELMRNAISETTYNNVVLTVVTFIDDKYLREVSLDREVLHLASGLKIHATVRTPKSVRHVSSFSVTENTVIGIKVTLPLGDVRNKIFYRQFGQILSTSNVNYSDSRQGAMITCLVSNSDAPTTTLYALKDFEENGLYDTYESAMKGEYDNRLAYKLEHAKNDLTRLSINHDKAMLELKEASTRETAHAQQHKIQVDAMLTKEIHGQKMEALVETQRMKIETMTMDHKAKMEAHALDYKAKEGDIMNRLYDSRHKISLLREELEIKTEALTRDQRLKQSMMLEELMNKHTFNLAEDERKVHYSKIEHDNKIKQISMDNDLKRKQMKLDDKRKAKAIKLDEAQKALSLKLELKRSQLNEDNKLAILTLENEFKVAAHGNRMELESLKSRQESRKDNVSIFSTVTSLIDDLF